MTDKGDGYPGTLSFPTYLWEFTILGVNEQGRPRYRCRCGDETAYFDESGNGRCPTCTSLRNHFGQLLAGVAPIVTDALPADTLLVCTRRRGKVTDPDTGVERPETLEEWVASGGWLRVDLGGGEEAEHVDAR